jgi:subtilisin family serine protease
MDGTALSARACRAPRAYSILLAALCVLAFGSVPAALARDSVDEPGNGTSAYIDGKVLVGFTDGTTAADAQSVIRSVGAAETAVIGAGTHVLRVPTGQVEETIARLRTHPHVRYAEPDYIVHADMTPNDSLYHKLWGLQKIHADTAWDSTTGTRDVVVGVVDTGIDYAHPDLAANVWSNNGLINGCAAGTHGYNALTNGCDPMDDHNHGTHVSGTIGAVGNNGIGVIGVDPNVSIMGLKFLNSGGSGTTSGAVTAIDWAVKAKVAGVNVRVLSNSWGGGGYSQALKDEIEKAGARDILFVAAAGNSGRNNDATPFYPCSYHTGNEICVAASDNRDRLASFSNYGASTVDLAAPGADILSTIRAGGYGTMSGTSMATPHVSGTAALVLAKGYESVADLKTTILSTVDPIADAAGKTTSGGRLDADAAVLASRPTPAPVGDFSLAVSPSSQAVSGGSAATYTVTLTPSGGFSGSVYLAASGLPYGTSASFGSNPVTVQSSASASTTLVVTTTASTPNGKNTFTITAIAGSVEHATTAGLQVKG